MGADANRLSCVLSSQFGMLQDDAPASRSLEE
jgi:hypothetical protein